MNQSPTEQINPTRRCPNCGKPLAFDEQHCCPACEREDATLKRARAVLEKIMGMR
jgi:predicted nucleic acid-binding Zn ribbon protein